MFILVLQLVMADTDQLTGHHFVLDLLVLLGHTAQDEYSPCLVLDQHPSILMNFQKILVILISDYMVLTFC